MKKLSMIFEAFLLGTMFYLFIIGFQIIFDIFSKGI